MDFGHGAVVRDSFLPKQALGCQQMPSMDANSYLWNKLTAIPLIGTAAGSRNCRTADQVHSHFCYLTGGRSTTLATSVCAMDDPCNRKWHCSLARHVRLAINCCISGQRDITICTHTNTFPKCSKLFSTLRSYQLSVCLQESSINTLHNSTLLALNNTVLD